ncbi:hypothetical protein MESS4_750277 [Mesorhizobium sp. STM 4661]|nr:hypothetical protein MESS4_750277 [Mesorhizobium sp. STM 4661]
MVACLGQCLRDRCPHTANAKHGNAVAGCLRRLHMTAPSDHVRGQSKAGPILKLANSVPSCEYAKVATMS